MEKGKRGWNTLIIKPIHIAQQHAIRMKLATLQLLPEELRVWTHLMPQLSKLLLEGWVPRTPRSERQQGLHQWDPQEHSKQSNSSCWVCKTSLKSIFPGHSTERTDRNIHLPVFPWKRPICKLQKLLPEGQALNLTLLEAVIPPPRNWGAQGAPSPCSFSGQQQDTSVSLEGAYAHIWHPSYCSCHQGTYPWMPGSDNQQGLHS